eukprot:g3613.t1
MGRGDEAFDTSKDLAAKVECAEAIFSPRFVSVIVASLTKLGTKFPEFAPRVVLCLLKMQQHYATDFSEGMDFVRDRLSDSLQLLRHSAISSSVYSSDRSLSSLSVLSSLGHLSHDPSAFTSGAALHDFELPHQPPNVAAAHGDAWSERPAGAWWEAGDAEDHSKLDCCPSENHGDLAIGVPGIRSWESHFKTIMPEDSQADSKIVWHFSQDCMCRTPAALAAGAAVPAACRLRRRGLRDSEGRKIPELRFDAAAAAGPSISATFQARPFGERYPGDPQGRAAKQGVQEGLAVKSINGRDDILDLLNDKILDNSSGKFQSLHQGDMRNSPAELPVSVEFVQPAELLEPDATEIFQQEQTLQEVHVDQVVVVGDLHGQFFDLLRIFEATGRPSEANPYLFNGDFVDRGAYSLEVILLLFALKLRYPRAVLMNRGNHEAADLNLRYGFAAELRDRYGAAGETLFAAFATAFRWLPLAHVVNEEDNVSLPPRDAELTLEEIARLPRGSDPATDLQALEELPEEEAEVQRLIVDLLWADPRGKTGYGPSYRNNLRLMIRSHEVKVQGYEWTHSDCITVFSAPNYLGHAKNKGAVVKLLPDDAGHLTPSFITYEAEETMAGRVPC